MYDFMDDMMANVFRDFKESVEQLDSCCILKSLRFDNGNVPDYENKIIQQLYFLRYFPAYFLEYYDIFRSVRRKEFLDCYNVLSIGCGSGLDYYGLCYAHDGDITKITYTGVDIIDWNYRNDMGNFGYFFFQQDISEWDELDSEDYNMICFPKSISEFTNATFNKLIDAIRSTNFKSDKICVVSSLREQHIESDTMRLSQILDALESEHGFSCKDKKHTYTHYIENKGLKCHFTGFTYPPEILKYITELFDKCKIYTRQGQFCYHDCRGQLQKWPVLKTGHICYQIKQLVRE